MRDALYIAGTIGFFGLMLGYVAACAQLGRSVENPEMPNDSR